MKVFIAGVMQGNRKDGKIHSQNYRKEITEVLARLKKNLKVVDPDTIGEQAAEIFFRSNSIVGNVDLVIAYLPEASMGTAVEMWEAWKNKVPIITISPLKYNWVVKLLSSKVYSTVADFAKGVEIGELQTFMKK